MSRRANNGPTFTKAPPKKREPMTDEERATWLNRKEAELEETKRGAEKSRRFHKRINEVGLFHTLFPKKD